MTMIPLQSWPYYEFVSGSGTSDIGGLGKEGGKGENQRKVVERRD
jgi:hypothetical protein